jgi:hypothetical protein
MSMEKELNLCLMSDNVVSMKTLTRRELSRKPSRLKAIKPGESVQVPDEQGGLVITRRKTLQLTPAEMLAQVDALTSQCPPLDTLAIAQEGED